MSAPRPYPSPLMTSGAIQYGVPITDLNSLSLTRVPGLPIVSPFIVVMFMSRLLAPKSVSFMFPLLSRNILIDESIVVRGCFYRMNHKNSFLRFSALVCSVIEAKQNHTVLARSQQKDIWSDCVASWCLSIWIYCYSAFGTINLQVIKMLVQLYTMTSWRLSQTILRREI